MKLKQLKRVLCEATSARLTVDSEVLGVTFCREWSQKTWGIKIFQMKRSFQICQCGHPVESKLRSYGAPNRIAFEKAKELFEEQLEQSFCAACTSELYDTAAPYRIRLLTENLNLPN
jgi:hypothetical protein